MKTIGLDLSINSTGICVCRNDKPIKYYVIASDVMSKKNQAIASEIDKKLPLKYYIYSKQKPISDLYEDKENAKTSNINNIASILNDILKAEKPDHAYIEGISYGSVGSAALADLAGLNFVIRWVLENRHIPFTIVSPTNNKKNACGNGSADKDEMIYAWEACDNRLKEYRSQLKFDDLADAYFLARTKNT